MNRYSLFVLLAIALAPLAAAQAGALHIVVVDREGKPVPDAVVALVPSHSATPRHALPTQVVITQEKMRFAPAVSLVALGAKGTFVNNDPWEHHVRASAAGVKSFDDGGAGGFELRLDGRPEGKPAKLYVVLNDGGLKRPSFTPSMAPREC